MVEIKNYELDRLMERQPFRVPEGYIEGFTDDFMRRLPKRSTLTETKVISFYDRLKPWLYIAASFIGLVVLFNIFSKGEGMVMNQDSGSSNANAVLESVFIDNDEDAEFLDFLEGSYVSQNALALIFDEFWDN